MSASIAGRSTILRAFCRATTTTRARISATPCPSIQSNFMPSRSPSSRWYILENVYACNNLIYERLDRLLRRELSSLQPLHSAIASACLISKLPALATSSEGRFVNYLSPI
ncbi:PREDICTED: pentatricopeptide repeat-containing At2g27800 mitochondrial [Prunus dulcis]|uniref:PREDICTED: pentatricopeptide repeat-containing At2g27800 mitochondrial n=1 Tax=Prunus dulcis TaxID=3755 RepID=A0A5E4FDN7_PRUDU|nr:PREDICTED: pentatricopeptide repeat-containing At2g27800 mitochondrial [Prunus dulcis]